MYLPYELIGLNRIHETKEFKEINQLSCMYQKFEMENAPNLSMKAKKIQKEFIEWMKEKRIITSIDFTKFYQYKCKVSEDRDYIKENDRDTKKYYVKEKSYYERDRYRLYDEVLIRRQVRIIAEIKHNRIVIIYSVMR